MTGTYNVVTENLTIKQAAERIQKLTNCSIEVSEENEDKRNYRVSAEKIKKFGFNPSKNLDEAFDEIKKAFEKNCFEDFHDVKFNNYKYLFNSKEMQEKVFMMGL